MIKDFKIENVFVFIALIFGLLYVLILPPFQSVDEGMHFFRTYQISMGHLTAKNTNGKIGDILPKDLASFYNRYTPLIKHMDKKTNITNIKNELHLKLNKDNTTYIEFTNTALYSPTCYISQLPGVILAKTLNLPLGIIFYLGRISNLIFYCLVIYCALKITPFFKTPMMLLALMPMSLSLAGAYTSDVMVFGLNFIFFAMILKLLVNNDKYIKNLLIMAILGFLIALTKSYILLLPLIFLIPSRNFKNQKRYWIFITSFWLSVIAGATIWYFNSKGLSLNMNTVFANSKAQKMFILTHPFNYIWIMIKTFFVKMPRLYVTMIGVLGWQDTPLDWITYMIYPILIYFGINNEAFNFKLQNWQKWVIIATIIFGIILTYTSLYIMWSPVKNPVVLGLNGKYFIPLMLPFLLLFKNNSAKFNNHKLQLIIIIATIFILISSDLSLIHRFYDMTPQLYYNI